MFKEWLIGLIEIISWLHLCWNKFYLDLRTYFHGVENGFESTSKGLKIGFGHHYRGWGGFNLFCKGWFLAAECLQSYILTIGAEDKKIEMSCSFAWRSSLTSYWQLFTAEFFFDNTDKKFHPWKVNICNFNELDWSKVCLVKHSLDGVCRLI